MRRTLTVVSALVVLTVASAAQAQEILLEGPLAGAPACRHCVMYRAGRFSLSPMFSFSLLDDYRRHIYIGLRAQYNITEWIAVGISGGYGGFWGDLLDTGLADQVAAKAPNGIETNRTNYPFPADDQGARDAVDMTTQLFGRILGFVSAELTFIPLRGKFAVFSRLFLDVDLYIFVGYALPFVEERADVDCRDAAFIEEHGGTVPGGDPSAWNAQIDQRCPWVGSSGDNRARGVPRGDARLAVGAGTYGIGVGIYAVDWLAINFEYRAMPFLWNRTGTDERGMAVVRNAAGDQELAFSESGEFPDRRLNASDRTWSGNHMFTLGVTFHFPFRPRRSP